MKSFQLQQSGFSLVETLVAITILLIVIIGPMSISTSTARSTSFSSEQVVAFFLAQEGAELVQKARDDLSLRQFLPTTDGNYLADPFVPFVNTTGTYQHCYTANGCGLEINGDATGTLRAPIACGSTGTNCQLYFDASASNVRSRYTHVASGNTVTPYTRIITMDETATGQVLVTSRVRWRTGNIVAVQEVEVQTYLFDVYGN